MCRVGTAWAILLLYVSIHLNIALADLKDDVCKDIKPNSGSCKVDSKMRGSNGYYVVPHDVKEGTTPEVEEILRLSGPSGFGDTIALERSADVVVFRSLSCTQYVSCQKIIDENGDEMIVKVTHLVSNTTFKTAQTGTLPVQIKFEGKYNTGPNANKDVVFIYNFYHYLTWYMPNEFAVPLGVVCEDKKTLRAFPKLPPHISFGQEIHYPDKTKKLETIETTYDSERRYVQEIYFDQHGAINQRRLDDFNSGLSFLVQEEDFSCKVTKISDATNKNDFVRGTGDNIQMVTPEQFFHSGGIKFHYNGKRRFEHLMTEVWTGKDEKNGHVYSWFFTS
ncbi:EF-hand domain-containing protein D1, partial [Elysia marginata]